MPKQSGAAASLLDSLDHQGRPPHLITRGDRVDLGNGAAIEVLWPPTNSTLSSNNTGLVLRLTYKGRSILFPADIQEPPERELLRDPQSLKSDVLIAPHHGSSEDSTAAFVAAASPALILSSNSARLTTRQRHFEQLVGHIPLYRTPACGAITVTIDRDGSVPRGDVSVAGARTPLDRRHLRHRQRKLLMTYARVIGCERRSHCAARGAFGGQLAGEEIVLGVGFALGAFRHIR